MNQMREAFDNEESADMADMPVNTLHGLAMSAMSSEENELNMLNLPKTNEHEPNAAGNQEVNTEALDSVLKHSGETLKSLSKCLDEAQQLMCTISKIAKTMHNNAIKSGLMKIPEMTVQNKNLANEQQRQQIIRQAMQAGTYNGNHHHHNNNDNAYDPEISEEDNENQEQSLLSDLEFEYGDESIDSGEHSMENNASDSFFDLPGGSYNMPDNCYDADVDLTFTSEDDSNIRTENELQLLHDAGDDDESDGDGYDPFDLDLI